MAVAVGAFDACDSRPELRLPDPRRGESRLLAAVRMPPLSRCDPGKGVRSILQDVVLAVRGTGLDLPDLLPYGDHRVAEAVQLRERFTFCRLYHQRPRHRKRDCRRVEPVIHQALRYVLDLHTARSLHDARIDD